MNIYVLRKSTLIKICAAIVFVSTLLITLISNFTYVKGAFSPKRELPIYSVETNEKTVSITFDCAWGADDIPDILRTLQKEDIKATFFIVGQWAEQYPEAVKMISEQGHDVANHSYSHKRFGALDRKTLENEITKCSVILSGLTGKTVNLVRPPYGDYSDSAVLTARELGYQTIQWNVDSLDWKAGIGADEIQNRVMKSVKPGSIILFHNDTAYTSRVLPSIISTLKSKGYGFKPVSSLILKENWYIDEEGRQRTKIDQQKDH